LNSKLLTQLTGKALDLLDRHPRRVTGALAALLLGTGVTAFGVAPQLPDPADQPVTTVVETVQPLPVAQQTEVLLGHRFNLFRTELTRSSDTADSLLARLGISDAQAASFLRKDALAKAHLLGTGSRSVTAEADDEQRLLKLSMRWASGDPHFFKRLVIERQGAGFAARVETAPYVRSTRLVAGEIQKSLEGSLERAGLNRPVGDQLTQIFGGSMDLSRAARKGDRFSVYHEVLEADGEVLRPGRVLAAELVYGGQSQQAMWFRHEGAPGQSKNAARAGGTSAAGAYYSMDGKTLTRGYIMPLENGRLTSSFAMRLNPVLNRMTAHRGVDYAAPPGTPVLAVANGTVDFAGIQNGYGNVIFIDHGRGHVTVYAHLSSMTVRRGQRVSQGQHIGGVGATGWATGPHLHFEFRVNGVHQDPVEMARSSPTAGAVAAAALPAFRQTARLMRQQLEAADTLVPTLTQ
jgi:murein DD-endopeptidase MepM/ murein hydrolase activator NlpD